MDKLRTAVIGLGWGRTHIEAYRSSEYTELVALCDTDSLRLSATMTEFGVTRGYTDVKELLAQPDIDALSIVLPNVLHAPVAIAAIEAGKHVLCEKPLAINAEAAAQMVAAAAEHQRKLMVCFNYRYRPDAQWVKQMIKEDRFGDIYYARSGWLRNSGIPGRGWFARKEMSGGGALIDIGVHLLDLTFWLLDHPIVHSVSGVTYAKFGSRGQKGYGSQLSEEFARGFDVDDFVAALIRFQDGRAVQLEVSWAAHTRAGSDDYFVKLFGSEAGVDLNVASYALTDTVTFYSAPGGAMSELRPRLGYGSGRHGHGLVVDDFARSILDDTTPPSPGEQGLYLNRVMDAIYASARSGEEVKLD
jgi:predicted dehydrogenase